MVFSPAHVLAADSISFINKEDFKNQQLVSLLLEHDFHGIAEVDLNNDSIDEYVLKRDAGGTSQEFQVLALINDTLVPLGNIRAQKLMIAYEENNGVRSILGFKDANNDYEYDIYAWDAMKSRYSNNKGISGGDIE